MGAVLTLSLQVPETQQEVDLLLDSNYAIISQLVRLRHTREAGKPRRVEHKLMAMLEKNLSKLVACQSPSALVSPRTAQATRAMMRQAKDTELAHAQAAAAQAAAAHEAAAAPQQTHMMQGAAVHPQGGMQMMPGGVAGGGAAGGGGAMQGMTSQGQMQQHRLHQPAHTLYGGGSGGGVDSGGGGGGMF